MERGARGNRFASLLGELKRSGCLVLVVGSDVRERARAAMTAKLCGEGDRCRVLAFATPTTVPVADWLPADAAPTDDTVTLVDWTADRAIAAAVGASGPEPGPSIADADLDRIETDLRRATWDLLGDERPPAGRLRVGVYALDALLDEHDPEAVIRFVGQLRAFGKSLTGMAFCHVQYRKTHGFVSALSEHADVLVQLRDHDGDDEHKWVLLGEGTESDWLPLTTGSGDASNG